MIDHDVALFLQKALQAHGPSIAIERTRTILTVMAQHHSVTILGVVTEDAGGNESSGSLIDCGRCNASLASLTINRANISSLSQ